MKKNYSLDYNLEKKEKLQLNTLTLDEMLEIRGGNIPPQLL